LNKDKFIFNHMFCSTFHVTKASADVAYFHFSVYHQDLLFIKSSLLTSFMWFI